MNREKSKSQKLRRVEEEIRPDGSLSSQLNKQKEHNSKQNQS